MSTAIAGEIAHKIDGLLASDDAALLARGVDIEVSGRHFRVGLGGGDADIVVTEVTARRLADDAQVRLDAVLEDIGKSLALPFFVKNARDLRFEYWSPRMFELSGISNDEISGTSGNGVFPPPHLAMYNEKDREVLRTNALVANDEPLLTRRGERWLHTQKVPIAPMEGAPLHVLGVAADITDRVHAESERGRVIDEIARAMAVRDRTLAAVAHDLGNPLAVLALTASAMRARRPGGAAALDRLADRVERAARQMTAVVSDLRSEALLREGRVALELHACDPRALIEDAAELDRALAESRGVHISAEAEIGLPRVICDRDRVARVLANLVGNAVEFTPSGGSVTLRAKGGGRAVRFEVADTGPGLRPDERDRVFEPYWQADPTRGRGTGLGLAIARGIVEAHGGILGVESEPGRGATFYFTLPRAP